MIEKHKELKDMIKSYSNENVKKMLNGGLISVPSYRLGEGRDGYEAFNPSYCGLEEVEDLEVENEAQIDFELSDLRIELNDAFNEVLSPKEKLVIELSFGLNGNEPLELREIAERLLVLSERVRQIRVKAIGKLKNYFVKQ